MWYDRLPQRAMKLKMSGRIGLSIAVLFAGVCCSTAFAQDSGLEFRQYHPGWAVIPQVRRPAFNYGEAQNSKLIAEAAERLDYLSIGNLVVDNTRGYRGNTKGIQVVANGNGRVTYQANIKKPKCTLTIVPQYINSPDSISSGRQDNAKSVVIIGGIDFSGC